MSRRGSAVAVLAGAAIFALAGCGGAPNGTAPDIPGQTRASTAPGGTSAVSGTARIPSTPHSVNSSTSTSTSRAAKPGSFVKADSIPFPVAVGNTWVYQTTVQAVVGRTTNRIVAAGPDQDGYKVTMTSTTDLPGNAAAVQSVYVFYPDGTIGYPVTSVNGVPVAGVVRWPDAAGLASGRAYHSMLRPGQAANVTVQGEGTTPVTVPAGTFQASVVTMTIPAKAGTVEVTTWIAEGIGPVKTTALIRAAGKPDLLTTSELRSFTKGTSVGIGS